MATKTMNVIMSLRDQISKPLKNVSKAMKGTSEKFEESKKKLNSLSSSQARYRKKLEESKSKLEALNNATEKNSEEIEAAKKDVVKYQKALDDKKKSIDEAKKSTQAYKTELGKLRKSQRNVQKSFDNMKKSAMNGMDNIVKKAGQLTLAVSGIAAGLGFKEAFDMEGYRVQLETAVKDTKLAGKLMSDAVKFANKTPFETGSVVEATAKMEAYGISSKRWLADVADMAGATNKSIDQATEAMADATMGEFERLKEFGIKKEMLIAAAAKKYGDNVVFNAKGQILDQIKLQDILQKTMQGKFKGGAEALSKTTKGLWSTVTGITKSSLAQIVGMQTDGTIKVGSLYDKLQKEIQKVVVILNKWAEDGTIQEIGEKITVAFTKIFQILKGLFDFLNRFKGFIEPILVFVGVIYTTVKAFQALSAIMEVVSVVTGILNGTLMISPLGWIAIAIGAVVGALYLLWKNWESVIGVFKKAWNWVTSLTDVFGKLKDKVKGAWSFVKGIFGDKEVNVNVNRNENSMEQYAQGGVANKPSIFGEAGPEIAIPLNKSSRSKSLLSEANKSIGGGSGLVLNFYGDIYGFEDFQEKVAEAIVKITDHLGPNVAGV
jgi:hypothetical protein